MTKTIGGCLLAGGMLALVCVLLFVSLFAAILGVVSSVFGQSGNRSCEPTPAPTALGHHGGAAVIAQVTSTATPISTEIPGCVPPNQVAAEVVALARQMADTLSVNPACGGIISYPDCYYTWYDSTFPQRVIAYGNTVCPGCSAWANGTYQCVSFVRGAYGPLYPMVWTANAFDLYALYAGKPGWQEIPSAAAPSDSGDFRCLEM